MLLSRNSNRLLHQQRAESLMLKLCGIPAMHGYNTAVHMKLANNRAARLQFRTKTFLAAFPQTQQAHKNILLGIFIRQKSLPAPIRHIIAPDQLNLKRTHFVVDLLNPHLPRANIPALKPQIFHPRHCKLPQIPVIHARSHQRHRNVPLNPIHSRPRRDQSKHFGHQIHQHVGRIALVATRFPQLIEPRASNHQSGVELEAIGSKLRILEKLNKPIQIALKAHIRKIRHHVGHNLEARILGKLKALTNSPDCMPSIRVASNIFIDTLHANFEPGAAIGKHGTQVRLQTVVWASFDGDSHTFGAALFRIFNSLLNRIARMPRQRIMQASAEIIPVISRQRHKCAPHHHKLDLIHTVAQPLQLIHPMTRLHIRIVARPNSSHRGRLIASVGLRRVLKVGIRPSRTVHADVARHCNVRATVRLGHDSYNRDAGRSADWFCLQFGDQNRAMRAGNGGDDIHQFWLAIKSVFARNSTFERIQIHRLAFIVQAHQIPAYLRHNFDHLFSLAQVAAFHLYISPFHSIHQYYQPSRSEQPYHSRWLASLSTTPFEDPRSKSVLNRHLHSNPAHSLETPPKKMDF
eukprot:Sdes_comp12699_c0_seq1m3001